MCFIKVSNLSKIHGSDSLQVKALDNVSFEIEKGEMVVILGASGAGKSTLLNILGGMDNPSSGEYIIDNEDISKFNSSKLSQFRRNDIGFVFQFYNLMNNLTAYENVEIAASIVKNPLDTLSILNSVGLKERMNNFPSQLSGGEQQRVSIARAIVKNPKLLLCDEPTGALDSKTGSSIIKLLHDISLQYKTTVIIVTHNAKLAPIADRLIRIKDGKIIENTKQNNKNDLEEIVW